jgi:predicted  nucleic acid-binding Zn-ribbon protein
MAGQGQGQSMKNAQVRNIGRQIETLEDQIDAAHQQGQDTTQMEQQLDALNAQMKQAQEAKHTAQQQLRQDRKAQRDAAGPGKSGQAPGQNKQ